jgi:hypothetical protein
MISGIVRGIATLQMCDEMILPIDFDVSVPVEAL